MKTKLMVGLGAVTAVVAAAAIAVSMTGVPNSSGAGAEQRLFPDLAARANDVASVVIAKRDGSFTLMRDGDAWSLPEKSGYPASFDKVRRLIVELADLRTMEAKTGSASLYPSLEVEDLSTSDAKSVVVTVKDAAGKDVVALIVGKQRYAKGASAAGDGTYVRKVGDAQAWLVRSRLSIDRDATRWLERRVVDVARERVELVRNVQGDGVRLVVAKARPADQDFSIADIPEGRKAKSSYDANSVGTAFDSLELDDVRPAADLAFPTEGAMAEMESFDGFVLRAVWAEKDGQNWVRLVARYQEPAKMPEASDSASAKLKSADDVRKEVAVFNGRHGAWAYRIPDYRLDYMKKKMNDLLEEKKEAS